MLRLYQFILLLLSSTQLMSESFAQVSLSQTALHVKPSRCVALRQGQFCYQNVKFDWQAPKNSRLLSAGTGDGFDFAVLATSK